MPWFLNCSIVMASIEILGYAIIVSNLRAAVNGKLQKKIAILNRMTTLPGIMTHDVYSDSVKLGS